MMLYFEVAAEVEVAAILTVPFAVKHTIHNVSNIGNIDI